MPAKKSAAKRTSKKSTPKVQMPTPKKIVESKSKDFQKECDHCEGVGKCTAGEPYDKGHHKMFGARVMLTSCVECLESAGEHTNSKKIVACRICGGKGRIEA